MVAWRVQWAGPHQHADGHGQPGADDRANQPARGDHGTGCKHGIAHSNAVEVAHRCDDDAAGHQDLSDCLTHRHPDHSYVPPYDPADLCWRTIDGSANPRAHSDTGTAYPHTAAHGDTQATYGDTQAAYGDAGTANEYAGPANRHTGPANEYAGPTNEYTKALPHKHAPAHSDKHRTGGADSHQYSARQAGRKVTLT